MNLIVISRRLAVWLSGALVFVLVLVLASCGGSPSGGGGAAKAPEAASATEAKPGGSEGPAPPDGGTIIVGPTGVTQGGTTLSYTPSTSVWIPQNFAGGVSSITLNITPPNGPIQSALLSSVGLVFSSGAGFKVTPGTSASWQCRADANSAWAACATQSGSSLPSLFTIDGSHAGSIVKPDGTTVSLASNMTIVIQ